MKDYDSLDMEILKDLVRQAGRIFYNSDLVSKVTVKGEANFVTQADVAVQNHLQRELTSRWPMVAFMGEEKDNSEIDFDGPVWILDPIDGTTNLMHDFHASAVSLAFADHHQVQLGLIYDPYRDELFTACRGEGAFLNGMPIHVSDADTLDKALMQVGTAPYHKAMKKRTFSLAMEIFSTCQDIRRSGSAAIDLAYVAAGRADGFYEYILCPWDYAAAQIILEEAGGTLTTMEGTAIDLEKSSSVLASNGTIHQLLLDVISNCKE